LKTLPRVVWIRGAVRVTLLGPLAELVVRNLVHDGVPLYGVVAQGGTCTFVICLGDFQTLYRISKQERVKIRIREKIGLPFLWREFAKRKMMIAGIAVFCIGLYVMSHMIWQVTVSGVENDDAVTIVQAAKDSGLSVGTWKGKIAELNVIQKKILSKVPSLIWVGIDIQGSRAKLEVVERIPGIPKSNMVAHNIVATKAGVILKVFTTRGQVLVTPGQVVQPGQVVISGSLADGQKQVPAAGQVIAEVWYVSKVDLPLKTNQNELTGEFIHRDYFRVGNLQVPIWGWQQPHYQDTETRYTLTDWHFGNWLLPIQWQRSTLYEVSSHSIQIQEQSLKQHVLELALQDVSTQAGAEARLLGQQVLHREVSHGKLYETILTKMEENIGAPAAIQPTPILPPAGE